MTDPQPAEATVTIASQSIELALTGKPDVKNKWGAGSIRPAFVTFTYLPEGIRAHLYGVWVREDGEATDAPCDQDYRIGDTDEWPAWMAELAREHKPAGPAPVTDQADRPINDMRELYAVQHAITDAGGTLTPAVHQAIDALRETWDRGLRRAQAAFTDRAAEAEPPLSPDYQHPDCGFHWHGKDGMDIPMRDGQPVCPRCELAAAEKRLRHSEKRCDELRAESKRRGKIKLEQAEQIRHLEKKLDEVRTQLGAEILRAGQAESELRRMADETQQPEAQAGCSQCGHRACMGRGRCGVVMTSEAGIVRPPCQCLGATPAAAVQQPKDAQPPTAYSDGKGRTYCLPCAPTVGADVPLTINDVDFWDLCPSCGRHVVDVARAAEQPKGEV